MSEEREGVIKFSLEFSEGPISLDEERLTRFNTHRGKMLTAGLMGQDPARYDGLGFGNISFRSATTGEEFYISGSQTGHLALLGSQDIALIKKADAGNNALSSSGLTPPSSESLTHAVLYQAYPDIQCVIHVHSPDIWQCGEALGLPSTAKDIPYGTPEMARAVMRLASEYYIEDQALAFFMRGHLDGVVVAGRHFEMCSQKVLTLQDKAREMLAENRHK